jgi:hypothetical protein
MSSYDLRNRVISIKKLTDMVANNVEVKVIINGEFYTVKNEKPSSEIRNLNCILETMERDYRQRVFIYCSDADVNKYYDIYNSGRTEHKKFEQQCRVRLAEKNVLQPINENITMTFAEAIEHLRDEGFYWG